MASKKQIILPALVIVLGVGAAIGLQALKKPPAEKPKVDNTPLVAIKENSINPMTFNVQSYGVVNAKYETNLISQVNGEIVYLSDKFLKGGFVKKGEVLARIDPSDYEAAKTDAEAALASANATLVQERAYGKVAEDEWSRITNGKPTELSLRKPQLAQELAKLKSSEAGLKRAKRNLERTVIKAPYDALIESREIGLGSYVSMGSRIGKVLSTSTAEIRLPVADKELQFLEQLGNDAVVAIQGKFAGQDRLWQGRIVRSEGVIDNKSRMTYLVAEVKDPYALKSGTNQLRYGSYVTAEIQGANAGNVSIVPRHLVVDGKVAVLSDDNRLTYKPVNVVRQVDSNVIISSGLDQGDKVIVSALDYPIEGMALALPKDEVLKTPLDEESQTRLAMDTKE